GAEARTGLCLHVGQGASHRSFQAERPGGLPRRQFIKMKPICIRKAIIYGAGDLRIDEEWYDPAALKATEVLVQTQATGFSTGTDLGNYQGRSTEVPGAPEYPRWVGYSNVGLVVAVG